MVSGNQSIVRVLFVTGCRSCEGDVEDNGHGSFVYGLNIPNRCGFLLDFATSRRVLEVTYLKALYSSGTIRRFSLVLRIGSADLRVVLPSSGAGS